MEFKPSYSDQLYSDIKPSYTDSLMHHGIKGMLRDVNKRSKNVKTEMKS